MPIIWVCPKCSTHIEGTYYLSYNTFGGKLFSDTYMDAPMAAPVGHEYVGCPTCNTVFVGDPKVNSLDKSAAAADDTVVTELPLWKKVKILLDTNAATSPDERKNHLILNLWAENHDSRINREEELTEPDSEEISIRVENYNKYADELISILEKENGSYAALMLVEVLRERGRFEEATKVLNDKIYAMEDVNSDLLSIADQMRERIKLKRRVPFEIVVDTYTGNFISNESLKLDDIPVWTGNVKTDVRNIIRFGHTYNGYKDASIDKCTTFFKKKSVPETLPELRTTLFVQQRAWRHWDNGPGGGHLDDEHMADERMYAMQLIDKIRDLVKEVTEYPKTVEQAIQQAIKHLGPKETEKIAAMKKEDLPQLHFDLGLWIRNNSGIYKGNKDLIKDLESRHPGQTTFIHEDDISSLIIEDLWEHLNQSKTAA
jgi:hypothetical protein